MRLARIDNSEPFTTIYYYKSSLIEKVVYRVRWWLAVRLAPERIMPQPLDGRLGTSVVNRRSEHPLDYDAGSMCVGPGCKADQGIFR